MELINRRANVIIFNKIDCGGKCNRTVPLALTVFPMYCMALLNVLVAHPATTQHGFSPDREDLSVNFMHCSSNGT